MGSMLKAMEFSDAITPALHKLLGNESIGAMVQYGNGFKVEGIPNPVAGYVVDFIPAKLDASAGCTAETQNADLAKITKFLDKEKIGYETITDQNRCGGAPHQRVVTDVLNEVQLEKLIGDFAKKKVSALSTNVHDSIAAIGGNLQQQLAEAELNGAAPAPISKQRSIV